MTEKERILKVYNLAQRGIGGEKTNAETVLQKLLKESGLKLEDLENPSEAKRWRVFPCPDKSFKKLLAQTVFKVLNVHKIDTISYPGLKEISIELSDAEFIRISMLYDIYAKAYRREKNKQARRHRAEKEALLMAFIYKNDILPASGGGSGKKPDEEELRNILEQMRNIDRVPVHEELPGTMLEHK